jgi:hypothetical protein
MSTGNHDNKFGLFFSGVFALFSFYLFNYTANEFKAYVCLIFSVVVGLVSLVAPRLLVPFEMGWLRLGELIGKIVSPLVLGIIFFMLITPVSLLGRILGRDELRLRKANTDSYWIDREPPGPDGVTFKNQF